MDLSFEYDPNLDPENRQSPSGAGVDPANPTRDGDGAQSPAKLLENLKSHPETTEGKDSQDASLEGTESTGSKSMKNPGPTGASGHPQGGLGAEKQPAPNVPQMIVSEQIIGDNRLTIRN